MALDTSVITAGIKPITQTNPLAMAGDLAKTQNTLLQARGNALQMAATMAQGQHWQEATNPNTGEFDAGKYAAAIAADPRTAWNAGKIVQQLQAQQKAQYDLNSQALQQTDARSGVLANALGPLARLGNNAQPSDVYGVVNRLHAAGYPTGEMVNQIAASMPTQGGQGLHNWVLNTLGSRMSPADQARTFLPQVGTMNTGGTTQTYDANPQTNPNVTSMAVPNTLTPEGQIAQVKGPVGRGGASTVQSGAAYAQSQGMGNLVPGATVPSQFGGATGRLPAALMGPNAAPSQSAAPAGQGASPAPTYGTPAPMVTGLGPGQQAALDVAGKASADQWAALQNSVGGTAGAGGSGSAARIYMAQHALDLLQQGGPNATGPSAPAVTGALSYMQSLPGVGPLANKLGITDPQSISNFEEIKKVLTASAMGRASAHGGTTDSQLATTLASNPSATLSTLTNSDLLKANIGLERMDQAQAKSFSTATDPSTGAPMTPDQFSGFSSDWNSKMDPRAFVADQLSPQQFASTVKGMSPDDQAKFQNTFNTAVKNGWMAPPAWMQQPSAAAAPTAAAPTQTAPVPNNAYIDPVTGLQPGPAVAGNGQ